MTGIAIVLFNKRGGNHSVNRDTLDGYITHTPQMKERIIRYPFNFSVVD